MVDLPSALFVSTCDEQPESIIRLMLNELPDGRCEEDAITIYDWHISNKYYEADVRLCSVKEKTLSSPEFASSVEAVIILFDPISPRGLDPVNEWMSFLNEYEAEVKILVCSRCPESTRSTSSLTKIKVQEWCVKEGFELVELEPVVDEEWENEQDFIETYGIERVIQALQAHVWPNLILKERKDPTTMAALLHGGFCKSAHSPYDSHIDRLQDTSDTAAANSTGNSENTYDSGNSIKSENSQIPIIPTRSKRPLDNVEPTLGELLAEEDTDFCDLFSQLPAMKERASAMPSEQRKKFAEDVVLAYWKAIGGDGDEILDC